jgi:hypothetical protein
VNLEQILAIIERIGSENAPSKDELKTARTDLARLMNSEAKSDAPDLTVLTTLRKAFTDAGSALVDAEAKAAADAAAVAELLDGIEDPDAVADPEPTDPPEQPADPAEPESIVTDPLPAPTGDPVQVPIAAAATPRTIPLRDAVTRVRQRPPAPAEPIAASGGADGIPANEIYVLGVKQEASHIPTLREAAEAFAKTVRSPSTGKATLLRYDSYLPETQVLPGTTEGNTRVIESLIGEEAVAAAGGCCSLPTPIRSQNVLSSTARPLRDALPTIGVQDTGAVTYFPAVCLPDEGAALWTCSEDEAVDFTDEDTWKECVFIDCPEAETTIVDAIYRCLTIGEFQRRFATEQWMAIIQATMALQSRVADARLWARMLSTVNTTHTGISTGSFYLNWAQTMLLAAESIREQQRLIGPSPQINLFQPHWTYSALASDLIARRLVSPNNPAEVQSILNSTAADAGVVLRTMGPDAQFIEQSPQADGSLQDYPSTAAMIMAPEGHYSYLDGGQFDLGIEIRDLDLMRQNAVAAFAEGFEGLLARGCNAKRLNIAVDICDTAPGCGS